MVKFKEEDHYSEKLYGPIKKEKKPAPKKICCVTEIMADISDSDCSADYDDTTSQEKPLLSSSSDNPAASWSSINGSVATSQEGKNMLPPDKLSFIANIRKRSSKGREKDLENRKEGLISKSLIEKVHHNKAFKLPFVKDVKQKEINRNLEALIYRKFHNRKSVSKILQKTAKLQKNLEQKLQTTSAAEDETTGDAIRYWMLQRIKSVQKYRAQNYEKKGRKRGKIDKKFTKLIYQDGNKTKRKTKNFPLFDQKQLDFPDANNLLNKKLVVYEYDNDMVSDEDEIAKSSYARLKDLTLTLKEKIHQEYMYPDDPEDIEIKKHVGISN